MELARYLCPNCKQHFDVWLDDDGKPERRPAGAFPADACPACVTPLRGRVIRIYRGTLDPEETALYDGGS